MPFAERIRREAEIATGAVGLITESKQAAAIIAESRADLVLLTRVAPRSELATAGGVRAGRDFGPITARSIRARLVSTVARFHCIHYLDTI